jgi:hypothetical protein
MILDRDIGELTITGTANTLLLLCMILDEEDTLWILLPFYNRSYSVSFLCKMRRLMCTKAAYLAALSLAIYCNAAPVQRNNKQGADLIGSSSSSPTVSTLLSQVELVSQPASKTLYEDLQHAGFNKNSDIKDLTSKMPGIFTKYGNAASVSKFAYSYLKYIGVTEAVIAEFKYDRVLRNHKVAQRRYAKEGIKRETERYKLNQGSLPKFKQGSVTKKTERHRIARDIKYQALIKRLTEAGLADEIDPYVFLKVEDDFKEDLSPMQYGVFLGEYMVKTRDDHDWYQSFVNARYSLKSKKYYARKYGGNTAAKRKRPTTAIGSKVILAEMIPLAKESDDPVTTEAQPFDKGNRPTRPRSSIRRPRRSYPKDAFRFDHSTSSTQNDHFTSVNSETIKSRGEEQPLLIFDDDPSNLWKAMQPSLETSEQRPTTAGKRYRGPQTHQSSEGSSSDTAHFIKRPTTGSKKFTGAGSNTPQFAKLAPKKATSGEHQCK